MFGFGRPGIVMAGAHRHHHLRPAHHVYYQQPMMMGPGVYHQPAYGYMHAGPSIVSVRSRSPVVYHHYAPYHGTTVIRSRSPVHHGLGLGMGLF